VSCELYLSHTAGTESFCENVVTKEFVGACARPTGHRGLASLTVGHGQSQSTCGSFSLYKAIYLPAAVFPITSQSFYPTRLWSPRSMLERVRGPLVIVDWRL